MKLSIEGSMGKEVYKNTYGYQPPRSPYPTNSLEFWKDFAQDIAGQLYKKTGYVHLLLSLFILLVRQWRFMSRFDISLKKRG